jgi:anaerobic dimethyl sulfoxide reductase subunit A
MTMSEARSAPAERVVRVGCPAHNCGGRCLLRAHVRDGVIVRLETDDRPDTVADPQLRACTRGRAYLRRQYHPDRLRHPLRRVGPRGTGRFERICWDEALDLLAGEIRRVRDAHGNGALFVPYGTGSYSQTNGSQTARRLLNLYGGCLGIWNSYSWGAINVATPTVYGTVQTGNQRQDWLNARYILMWSWNPAEMRDGTNSEYFLKLARERGARVVCIDPRLSMSAAALADEWVAIRPGTDAAMMTAMAHVILTEALHDADFVRTHCQGVDATQMPAGYEGAGSWSDDVLGTRDGTPKTPEWAEPITGVPRETIARIAREYATTRPGVLYQGYGMQRRAHGEQVVRAGAALAALTGNIGVPGGWASGLALQAPDGGPLWNVFPVGENPVGAAIPCFLWTEAVLRGRELGGADGVLFDGPDGEEGSASAAAAVRGRRGGSRRLDSDIKLIWAVASNALVNQHANINRTARILADESRVEFIAVQDHFLTPTARFADLVLPAATQFETWGVEDGWKYGDEVLLMPPLVEPPAECRTDYRICADVAERLGIGEAYTEGRDERGWVEWALDRYRATRFPDLPSLDELERSNQGVHSRPVTEPAVALADFRADPVAHPLPTPSGRIEIFSAALHDMADPHIPAVPRYLQEWESPFGPEAARYPLQAMGHHTMARVHSTHDNNDWLEEAFPHRVFMNDLDARDRGIADGDPVRVWNDRGAMVLPARVTPRIMPGVVDIPQGAWWSPDADGVDRRGCINVLTSERWTALGHATAQHTVMVEVERATAGTAGEGGGGGGGGGTAGAQRVGEGEGEGEG